MLWHVQRICKVVSMKLLKIAICINLDPQKFSAVRYAFKIGSKIILSFDMRLSHGLFVDLHTHKYTYAYVIPYLYWVTLSMQYLLLLVWGRLGKTQLLLLLLLSVISLLYLLLQWTLAYPAAIGPDHTQIRKIAGYVNCHANRVHNVSQEHIRTGD